MFGFLIFVVIVIALVQRHRYSAMKSDGSQRRYRVRNSGGSWSTKCEKGWDKVWEKPYGQYSRKIERYAERYKRKAEHYAQRAERWAAQFERTAGVKSAPQQSPPPPPSAPPKPAPSEDEAYRQARAQAAREAGFYMHLMWYGITIGFLFLINLLTTSYPWFLWPALGWGFGLMSHFAAVYGWDWVRQRVFEPAIQREVQREVLHEKEALQTEKQNSLDELTATFAHEIRNPIAAAKSLVQQMGEDPTSGENVEYAKVALDELARVERSVSHLLKYAKEEDYNFGNANLAVVLDSSLTQMRQKLESHQVAVSRNYLGGPTIRADADKLRQVFSNVIDNAIDSMDSTQGERRLEVAISSDKGAGFASIGIRDNGCGIAEDRLAKIFNPFYTSKTNGTGLGMAVAKKIVEAHRGTIEAQSEIGAGTEFRIVLPLSDAPRETRESRHAESASAAGDGQLATTAANVGEEQPASAPEASNNGAPAPTWSTLKS